MAQSELHTDVIFEQEPLKVTEFILPNQAFLNHFISLLDRCRLTGSVPDELHCKDLQAPKQGKCVWFSAVPENLLKVHRKYEVFLTGCMD